jgi:hypothetical protein
MCNVETLPLELRARLDAEPVRAIVEYVADRLGLEGRNVKLEVHFDEGRLRKAYLHRGPLGVEAIEELAAREAPQG